MLKRAASSRSLILAAFLLCAPRGALALPIYSFTFTQSFQSGASLSGSFGGVDLDSDGWLSSFASEITAFSMSYSGSIYVMAFSHTMSDFLTAISVGGLVYRLGSPLVGDSLGDDLTAPYEGIASGPLGGGPPPATQYAYRTGFGPTGVPFQPFGFVEDNTSSQNPTQNFDQVSTHVVISGATVSEVPEPGTFMLVTSGLLATGMRRLRASCRRWRAL